MRRLGHTLSAEENSEAAELQSQHQSQLLEPSGCFAKMFRPKSVRHFFFLTTMSFYFLTDFP